MEQRRKKGDRVLLSVFLAFFLPAALIGFLAMGMVADQKKIREAEIKDSWNRDIDSAARRFEAEIGKQAEAVFVSVTALFTPASDRPAFIEALKAFFMENKNVSYPFLFSVAGKMILPSFGNSRAPVRSDWMEKWDPPVSDQLWRRAEHVEFSEQNPLAAIPLYLALEKRVPRQALPNLYLAVARCYAKAGKRIQAREYGLAAFEQAQTAPTRPDRLDLYALRQLGLLSRQMESPQEAFSYYLRLYESLTSQPVDLSQDLQVLRWEALDFLKNSRDVQPYLKKERAREIDEKALDLYRGEISLFSDLSASFPVADLQAADRDRFLKLKEMFDPETSDTLFYRSLEKRFPSWRSSIGNDTVHFHSGIFQHSPFLLACARIRDRADGSSFYFGCKFQFQDFFSRFWPALVSSLRLPRGAAIVLSGPDGKPLTGSESAAKKRSVLSVPGRAALAGWTFQLRTDNSRIFSSLALKTLLWYYTLIAALFASLGLGIVLLLRYLGNERRWLRQKAEFVDMTSHTLKTPLTRLRLLAEKLEQGWVADAGRARDNCRAIAAETTHMAQLVDRMLDFSALRSGRASYRFEPRPVGEWLEGVLQKFKLPFAEKEFQAEVEIAPALPIVRIDPEAMGTALSNLVENVLQHAAAGKYIGISAAARDGCLEIAVSDRGPGIALEDRRPLFEPFVHGGGKDSGRGLGLAICRQIVEAHGGAVRAEAAPGGGSRFVITLPLDLK